MEFSGEVRARVESRLGFRVGGKIAGGRGGAAGQGGRRAGPAGSRTIASPPTRPAQVAAAATNRDLAAADYRRFVTLREQNFISGPNWSAARRR